MKNKTTTVIIVISTVLLAIASVFIVMRIRSLGTKPVAPNVPESKPQAQNINEETLPVSQPVTSCVKTFIVVVPSVTPTSTPGPSPTPTVTPNPTNTPTPGPSSTPSPGPSATPTPGPTSTPPPGPTNTPAPGPSSTPVPTTYTAQQPAPTEAQLPEAGIKLPALGGMILGFLLISLGIVFVF